MPTKKTPAELVLDPYSFNGAERLEIQTAFDTAFGDLLQYVRESWDPNRSGPMASAVVARDGTRHFPDQILARLLWVQERRTRPDAELSEFENLPLAELNSAHVRGLIASGKALKSTRSRQSSSAPDSSVSTTAE